jgi:hypothetical protein
MIAAVLLGPVLLAAAGESPPDATATLRRMLDRGGVVELAAGTYEVSPRRGSDGPMLSIRGGTTLRCAPGATIRIRDGVLGRGESLNEARVLANLDEHGKRVDGDDVRIEGCTFDGNDRGNAAPSHGSPELITCVRCERLVVAGNTFLDVGHQAVATYFGSGHVVERNRLFGVAQTQNADAIQLNGGRDVRIVANGCTNCSEAFVVQHATGREGGPARGGLIADNVAESLPADGACTGRGMPFACCDGARTGTGRDLCAPGHAVGSSIIVVAEDVTVRGNVLRDVNQISVQAGRGHPVRRVVVEQNRVLGGVANGILLNVIDGPGSVALDDVVVRGNEVRGVAASGVQLRGNRDARPTGVVIEDNVFADNCRRSGCEPGVLVGDGVDRPTLRGNRVLQRGGSPRS